MRLGRGRPKIRWRWYVESARRLWPGPDGTEGRFGGCRVRHRLTTQDCLGDEVCNGRLHRRGLRCVSLPTFALAKLDGYDDVCVLDVAQNRCRDLVHATVDAEVSPLENGVPVSRRGLWVAGCGLTARGWHHGWRLEFDGLCIANDIDARGIWPPLRATVARTMDCIRTTLECDSQTRSLTEFGRPRDVLDFRAPRAARRLRDSAESTSASRASSGATGTPSSELHGVRWLRDR